MVEFTGEEDEELDAITIQRMLYTEAQKHFDIE